jgi:3-hydroxy-9,10-secoandrosta-1,3,5(10)-triene-9,17-dione monooxygenase reductase component
MDDATFKAALSRFATGVTIITTREADGSPVGFTASSFTSLSLDPPLVLFCLARNAASFDAFTANPAFAVNILADGQQDISNRFAQRGDDKFAGVATRVGKGGAPLIEGSLAGLECRTTETLPGGDHLIFVGQVEEIHLGEGGPLLYYRGQYETL